MKMISPIPVSIPLITDEGNNSRLLLLLRCRKGIELLHPALPPREKFRSRLNFQWPTVQWRRARSGATDPNL